MVTVDQPTPLRLEEYEIQALEFVSLLGVYQRLGEPVDTSVEAKMLPLAPEQKTELSEAIGRAVNLLEQSVQVTGNELERFKESTEKIKGFILDAVVFLTRNRSNS